MEPLRPKVALAIDGGGIKGLIVAQALKKLEAELGGDPLITHPQIKVLSGTSTGAIITAGLSVGMTMDEITKIYLDDGRKVFPPLYPDWIPGWLQGIFKIIRGIRQPYLYSGDALKSILQARIEQHAGNRNLTLADLKGRLQSDQALVLTAVNVIQRRTHFLKSYADQDGAWELWAATLASSSAPTVMPVVKYKGEYYIDGGVGSYGNPGYIAAREAVEWQGYDPKDVTVLSFGTGWVPDAAYAVSHPPPDTWVNLDWAMNAIFLMLADANRAQSLDIIHDFVGRGMDFRRFQIVLDPDIDMTDSSPATMTRMKELGDQLGERILNNEYVREIDSQPQFDPEGLLKFAEAVEESKARAHRS
jgi:predicted acylesterase/phospholipase RssA